MLEIFDKSRKRIAIAENASGVEEERKINCIASITANTATTPARAA